MKRLITLPVLSLLLVCWTGNQLFTNASQAESPTGSPSHFSATIRVECQIPGFYISLVEKEPDFDDLLEFTSASDYSENDVFSDKVTELPPDRTNKENQRASFKCFNREYDSGTDKLFAKYPDAYSSLKKSDRYVVNIPVIFLSPKEHPPELLG